MKYPTGKLYLAKVEETVKAFVDKHELIMGQKIIVAVSGGVDSLALLHILQRCGYSTKTLYINHGTRASQNTEQNLVKKTAELLGVSCATFKIKNLQMSNFENSAREQRQRIYEYMSHDGHLVALGHHIDDSFEWSLMQKSKSSNVLSSIGIPVKNKHLIRPLMCLTKKQIRRYAKIAGIKSLEDPTNKENRFERNYFRNEVIPLIAKRHPQYLKHYVNQQNELVRIMGLGLKRSKSSFKIDIKKDSVLIYSFDKNSDLDSLEKLILEGVKSLSSKKRGTLNIQIKKIKQALVNNKNGPLLLTDGVHAFVSTNAILLSKKKSRKPLGKKSYKNLDLDGFKYLLKSKISQHENFPHWVELDEFTRVVTVNKRVYPYNKDQSVDLIHRQVPHQNAFKLLLQWDTDKNRGKMLDLTF